MKKPAMRWLTAVPTSLSCLTTSPFLVESLIAFWAWSM